MRLPFDIEHHLGCTDLVRDIITIHNLSDHLPVLQNDPNSSPFALLHVDLAVVHGAHTRSNLVLLDEDRSSALILQRHDKPLVVALWIPEHIHSNPLIVISKPCLTSLEVFINDLVL
jgi:hypothetical protein